jgi:hypothetical protein
MRNRVEWRLCFDTLCVSLSIGSHQSSTILGRRFFSTTSRSVCVSPPLPRLNKGPCPREYCDSGHTCSVASSLLLCSISPFSFPCGPGTRTLLNNSIVGLRGEDEPITYQLPLYAYSLCVVQASTSLPIRVHNLLHVIIPSYSLHTYRFTESPTTTTLRLRPSAYITSPPSLARQPSVRFAGQTANICTTTIFTSKHLHEHNAEHFYNDHRRAGRCPGRYGPHMD